MSVVVRVTRYLLQQTTLHLSDLRQWRFIYVLTYSHVAPWFLSSKRIWGSFYPHMISETTALGEHKSMADCTEGLTDRPSRVLWM